MILSIDPGVTTGWAVLTGDGAVVESGNLKPEDVADGLAAILMRRAIQAVVVEKFPVGASGGLSDTLRDVVLLIDAVLLGARLRPERVTPGVWKTSSEPKVTAPGLTQHERDAIRMGRWFLRRSRK